MSAPIADRVAAGVELLDRSDPDWVYEVDLETLDIAEAAACVVGQQPGGFSETLVRLGLAERDAGLMLGYRVDFNALPPLGFSAHIVGTTTREVDQEYAALTVEWRRVITERRAADAAAAAGK